MPRANALNAADNKAKLLLIGDGKIGKTHYAGLVAEQGFNVLYLDGDVGSETLSGLSEAAKANIYLVQCGDRFHAGGGMSHDFVDFFVEFTSKIKLLWDDSKSRIAGARDDFSESEVWEFKPSALDSNWVLVIDSWTSLVQSIMLWAAKENNVDLSEADSPKMRPVYGSSSTKATQFLAVIRALGCHVIVIAHPDEYSKLEKPEGIKIREIKETDMRVAWTKLIPKSTSRPHSMQMAKFFTDVAWMEASRDGKERLLDFKISPEKISGGHFTDKKPMAEYSFAKLVEAVGGRVPTEHAPIDSVLKIHERGTYGAKTGSGAPLNQNTGKPESVTSAPKVNEPPAQAKPVGLAALMAKKV